MKKILIAISILASSCSTPSKDGQTITDSVETKTEAKVLQDSMPQSVVADSMQMAQQPNNNKYRYKIITGNDNSFGYDIYMNEKLSIHQDIIPGLPGNSGFKTEEEAKKVAELVIYKLQHNIMPPSVTKQEMDSVLKK